MKGDMVHPLGGNGGARRRNLLFETYDVQAN